MSEEIQRKCYLQRKVIQRRYSIEEEVLDIRRCFDVSSTWQSAQHEVRLRGTVGKVAEVAVMDSSRVNCKAIYLIANYSALLNQ